MEENGSPNNAPNSNNWKISLLVFFKDARLVFKLDTLSREILGIAFPSALAVAADPLASLIDTAFIGRLGPVELAAAGVSIALFNQASRITIFPLVSITTSFVAEEDTIEKINNAQASEKQLMMTDEFNDVVSSLVDDHDHKLNLHDVEKGKATKENNNTESPEEESSAGIGNSCGSSNKLTASAYASASALSENVEKHAIVNIGESNNGDGIFLCSPFLSV